LNREATVPGVGALGAGSQGGGIASQGREANHRLPPSFLGGCRYGGGGLDQEDLQK
jgi:hypothetical protein